MLVGVSGSDLHLGKDRNAVGRFILISVQEVRYEGEYMQCDWSMQYIADFTYNNSFMVRINPCILISTH